MPWSRKTGTLARMKPKKNSNPAEKGWGAWQAAGRFSYSDLSDKEVDGGVGQSITVALNCFLNPNARFGFNYIHGWIDESSDLDAVGRRRAEYDIVGARLDVDF